MTSEYMEKLNNILNDYKTKASALLEEYSKLTSIDSELGKEEISRIKEIKPELKDIKEAITDLENDIKTYQEQEDKITNLENIINQSNDVGAKYLIGKEKSELEKEHNELGEALVSKYTTVEEETKDAPVFDESKTSSRKILYGVVAVLAALGITIGVVSCSKQNKKPISENNTNITEVDNTKVEDGFVNIDDAEAVYERATEIKPFFDTYAKDQNITLEDIEDFLRYINGGAVNEVSYEAAGNVLNQINLVLSNEMAYSVDKHNTGMSNREKNDLIVDYSKLFLDGSNAQRLATKINDIRSKMITTDGNITSYQKEFTNLLLNSWYLHGYNEIDAYALETSGMAAVIDTMFLNTAALAVANEKLDYDVVVKNEITGRDITLTQIVEEINEANCEVEGEKELYSKFNSDFYGMVAEAAYNKENNNSLTLK